MDLYLVVAYGLALLELIGGIISIIGLCTNLEWGVTMEPHETVTLVNYAIVFIMVFIYALPTFLLIAGLKYERLLFIKVFLWIHGSVIILTIFLAYMIVLESFVILSTFKLTAAILYLQYAIFFVYYVACRQMKAGKNRDLRVWFNAARARAAARSAAATSTAKNSVGADPDLQPEISRTHRRSSTYGVSSIRRSSASHGSSPHAQRKKKRKGSIVG